MISVAQGRPDEEVPHWVGMWKLEWSVGRWEEGQEGWLGKELGH